MRWPLILRDMHGETETAQAGIAGVFVQLRHVAYSGTSQFGPTFTFSAVGYIAVKLASSVNKNSISLFK